MSAPTSALPEIPRTGSEVETLTAFLDYYRVVLRRKAEGLTAQQLDFALPPSSMTLGGMLKHLTYVEYWWYVEILGDQTPPEPRASVDWSADSDWDWHSAVDDSPSELLAEYDRACAESRDAVAGVGLDEIARRRTRHGAVSLRWIHVHMIEEYARHCGHADLLREAIDGETGD